VFVLYVRFSVLCTGRGLVKSSSPVQVVLPTVLDLVTEVKRKVSWRRPRPEMGCRAKGIYAYIYRYKWTKYFHFLDNYIVNCLHLKYISVITTGFTQKSGRKRSLPSYRSRGGKCQPRWFKLYCHIRRSHRWQLSFRTAAFEKQNQVWFCST
jgi:hypothetical protein